MAVSVTVDQVVRLAPNLRSDYRDAFATGQGVLDAHGVSANPLRVAHFMAQVLHECGALTIRWESLLYSPERLLVVFPKYFKTLADAEPYSHNEKALGDKVYGGRMGNDGPHPITDTAPHDGYVYRGRGMLQITGKDAYKKYGTRVGADLVATPDLAFSAQYALEIACAEWEASGCNPLADEDNLRKVTYAVNGGLNGLAERTEWLRKTKAVWS